MLFSYIENSYVWNLGKPGRGDVNELRFYDHDNEYTFNALELSVKKDPSERYRLGYGAVVTAGVDSQKNHSLGIFRDRDDQGPLFRNTPKYDLVEAYASFLVPVGNGLTVKAVKAGKWATLIGYEVDESPKNLNFSRSFLYTLGTPYTHTGLLLTYPVTPWFSVSAGFTNGWDNADNNNGYLRPIGSFAFTPSDRLSATVSYLFGPEQNRDQMRGKDINNRWVVDTTILYTGIDRVTLAVNFDFAGEENDPALVAVGRQNANSSWGGVAGYVGYDWTKALRTVLRLEYFYDPHGVRSTETGPGSDGLPPARRDDPHGRLDRGALTPLLEIERRPVSTHPQGHDGKGGEGQATAQRRAHGSRGQDFGRPERGHRDEHQTVEPAPSGPERRCRPPRACDALTHGPGRPWPQADRLRRKLPSRNRVGVLKARKNFGQAAH